jgi:pyruvate kinase
VTLHWCTEAPAGLELFVWYACCSTTGNALIQQAQLLQVSVGDIMLVDGGLSTFKILSKTPRDVHMEVVDGGRMTSRSVTLNSEHVV